MDGNVSEACGCSQLLTLTSVPRDPGHITPGCGGLAVLLAAGRQPHKPLLSHQNRNLERKPRDILVC